MIALGNEAFVVVVCGESFMLNSLSMVKCLYSMTIKCH